MAAAQAVIDIIARDKASAVIGQVGNSTDKAAGKMDGFKKAAVLAGAVAGAALIKFGIGSVKAFQESEEAQKRLAFAFEKFPKLASTSQAKLQGLNSALQKKTKFDDDAIASGQAMLAQFGVTGKQLEDTTPLMLDYASATGKDMTASSKDVGKALLGNAKALKNIGIVYTATGDRTKDFNAVTKLMRQQIGGFAEKEGTTSAGKIEIMKNQFGELQETVGMKLVPVLIDLVDWGLKVIDFISRNKDVILPLVGGVAALAAAVWVVNAAHRAWTATTAAFNTVMAMNPISLVILAIAALVVGIVICYKKFDTFRYIANKAIKLVAGAYLTYVDSVLWGIQKILEGAGHLPKWLGGGAFDKAAEAVAKIRSGIQSMKDKINELPTSRETDFKFQDKEARKRIDAMKEKLASIPRVVDVVTNVQTRNTLAANSSAGKSTAGGQFAAGGRPPLGAVSLVGERGPELFVPDSAGTIVPYSQLGGRGLGGGGVVRVIIDLHGADADLKQRLRKMVRVDGRGDVQVAFGTT